MCVCVSVYVLSVYVLIFYGVGLIAYLARIERKKDCFHPAESGGEVDEIKSHGHAQPTTGFLLFE